MIETKMNETINSFIEYQNKFGPIIAKLKEGRSNDRFSDWKGFITVSGPIVYQPEILFIGINPGPGLYNQINHKSNEMRVPFRILTGSGNEYSDEHEYPLSKLIYRSDGKTIALDWFIRDNYEEGTSWYEMKTKKRNGFIENMIKIICNVAGGLRKGDFTKGEKPAWYDTFGKEIMFMNVSPFATDNLSQLQRLQRELKVDEWNDIVKPLRVLIRDSIKPKVIVFVGVSAYRTFMWKYKGDKVFDIPVVVIDRKRGYNSETNLANVAAEIVDKLLCGFEKRKAREDNSLFAILE